MEQDGIQLIDLPKGHFRARTPLRQISSLRFFFPPSFRPSLAIVSPNLMVLRNEYPVNNYPNFGRSNRSGRFSINCLK